MRSFEADRADAVAGEARQGPGARRQGAGHHRPHHGAQLRHHPGGLPAGAAGQAAAGRSEQLLRGCVNGTGRHRIGPIPARACRSACSPTSICVPRRNWASATGCGTMASWPEFLVQAIRDLRVHARATRATRTCAARSSRNLVEPMLELSKCQDFVVNRGHYFGTTQVRARSPA